MIIVCVLFVATSCTNSNKEKSQAQGLLSARSFSPGNNQAVIIVDQNGDTLIITKKDSVVTVSKDTTVTVSVHAETSVTIPVFDTAWHRKGSGGGPIDTTTTPPVQPSSVQGYGVDAIGGSNSSTVYHVTNLNASGAGSLANGIGSNKTIVFDVEGNINVRLYVQNVNFLTIDAYTGKKDITVTTTQGDACTVENSGNVIIRGIRFVSGGTGGNDCLNATESSHDVLFDHCSTKAGWDGNIDLAAVNGKKFTVQYCLMYSNRGSGSMLITTSQASVHHNIFFGNVTTSDGEEREPYAHSNYSAVGSDTLPNFDVRNNIMTGTGRYTSGCGYGSIGNFVNNYYVATGSGAINLCADNIGCGPKGTSGGGITNSKGPGKAYVAGNYNQSTATGNTISSTEFLPSPKFRITTTDAVTAAKATKASAGTWKRTTEEQNLINAIVIP